jgi:hypothetical protein
MLACQHERIKLEVESINGRQRKMRASAYDPITDLSKKLCHVLTFLRSNINIERKVDNLHNVRMQLFVFKACNTTMFQKHLEKIFKYI